MFKQTCQNHCFQFLPHLSKITKMGFQHFPKFSSKLSPSAHWGLWRPPVIIRPSKVTAGIFSWKSGTGNLQRRKLFPGRWLVYQLSPSRKMIEMMMLMCDWCRLENHCWGSYCSFLFGWRERCIRLVYRYPPRTGHNDDRWIASGEKRSKSMVASGNHRPGSIKIHRNMNQHEIYLYIIKQD